MANDKVAKAYMISQEDIYPAKIFLSVCNMYKATV